MKVHVLYDGTGRILAAVHLDPPEGQGVGELRPVPQKGQMSGDFAVPTECADLNFSEACEALRVDTKNRKLIMIKPSRREASERSTKKQPRKRQE
jgi:hypothetical protein